MALRRLLRPIFETYMIVSARQTSFSETMHIDIVDRDTSRCELDQPELFAWSVPGAGNTAF